MMVESGAIIAAVYVRVFSAHLFHDTLKICKTAALVLEKRGSPVTHIMLNMLEPLYVSASLPSSAARYSLLLY